MISSPENHIFILISDLYEGYGSAEMISRLQEFSEVGVRVIVLLALYGFRLNSYVITAKPD